MSPAIKYPGLDLKDSYQRYFILSNKHGGFITISNDSTNFQGWIEREHKYLKLLDKISLDQKLIEVKNDYNKIKENYENNSIEYSLFENGLKLNLKKDDEIKIDLDIRRIYNDPKQGRIYNIIKKENSLIIEYSKYKTDQLKELEFKKYISFKGIKNIDEVNGEWIKKEYDYDKRRNSKHIYYVFRLNSIKAKKLSISYSDKLIDSVEKSNFLINHKIKPNYLIDLKKKNIQSNYININDELVTQAYKNAFDGLRKLAFEENNTVYFYAGHPWFFQVWTRDLLKSMDGIKIVNKEIHEKLVKKLIKLVNEDGMMNIIEFNHHNLIGIEETENKNKEWINNADSMGWYAKILNDYIKSKLEKSLEVDQDFLKKILVKFSNYIKNTISSGEIKYLKKSKPRKTWMDTIDRSGYRIEIQTHLITIYELIILISNHLGKKKIKKDMKYFKNKTEKEIKKYFIKDGIIVDGFHIENGKKHYEKDNRPNVFLAYKSNKRTFKNKIWERTFDELLRTNLKSFKINLKENEIKFSLLSTINYKDSIKHYSGVNDESYHMGDSWYFINNIASKSLYDLNKEKYKKVINELINSSIYDSTINNSYCSEVTSIDEIKPFGCFNQLWSNATLIELLEHIQKDN